MSELIHVKTDDGYLVVRKLRDVAIRVSGTPGIRWVVAALSTMADYIADRIRYHRYVRLNCKEFHKILNALRMGNDDARLCCRFCERLQAHLEPEQRAHFVDGFLSIWACDTNQAIAFFAAQEKAFAEQILLMYRIN